MKAIFNAKDQESHKPGRDEKPMLKSLSPLRPLQITPTENCDPKLFMHSVISTNTQYQLEMLGILRLDVSP